MLKRLIVISLISAFSCGLPPALGQQNQGHGRRHGHHTYPEDSNPNIYEAPLPRGVDGSSWDRKRLQGKIVVLDFWATWCAPCLNQIPDIKRLHDSHSRDELIILGVNLDTGGNRSLRRWLNLNRHKVTWPQLFTRGGFNGPLPRCYGIKDIPEILIFNQRGELVHRCKSAECTSDAIRMMLADK